MHPKLLFCLGFILPLSAVAQKLPNVQQASVWAPANIKIDGKPAEWEHFEAYNKATNVKYTMCNDAENLYLAIQVSDPSVMSKITGGGITLVIQKSGKKDEKGGIKINYPLFDKKTRPIYLLTKPKPTQALNKEMAIRFADSTMKVDNERLDKSMKYISIEGAPTLPALMSIYNDEGIKALGYVDNKYNYTCELSVNLKHLGLDLSSNEKFAYHILINAGPNKDNGEIPGLIMSHKRPDGTPLSPAEIEMVESSMQRSASILSATTDFWGEYTIAVKK